MSQNDRVKRSLLIASFIGASALMPMACHAGDTNWAWHVQSTYTVMEHNRFTSPYTGANSLVPSVKPQETFDATLYLGYRPWNGGEIWLNPEIDQGFGLSDTLGVAGYPSGEAYKVGKARPYLRLQRWFLRQTFNLGGDSEDIDADLNQFKISRTTDRIVLTVGKFGVPDVFDGSVSAHDPRHDFLNWSVIDTGSFDYAADAWGYTEGAAVEWYKGRYAVRFGLFDMSDVPNSTRLDDFSQMQTVVELEERHKLAGHDGAIRLTGFASRARMASFAQAVALTPAGQAPDAADFRRYRSRSGVAVSADQALSDTLSIFARAGASDGHFETYEFTDIDRTLAAGLSLKGDGWKRKDDTWGIALVNNDISRQHAAYLAAGGLGPLIGDGQLPRKRQEDIVETYYSVALGKGMAITADYQYIRNPAYNPDRGPVSIVGVRLHGQY